METHTEDIEIPGLLDELEAGNESPELEDLHNEFIYVTIDKENQFAEEVKQIWEEIDMLIARRGLLVKGTSLYARVVSHNMLDAVNERLGRASVASRLIDLMGSERPKDSRLSFLG